MCFDNWDIESVIIFWMKLKKSIKLTVYTNSGKTLKLKKGDVFGDS